MLTGSAAEPLPAPRLTGSPFLRSWQPEDYGGSPVNWRVLQHPATGFIYATNNLGLLEFDGARWRLLSMPRGSSARSLVVDGAGRLWVGGIGEVARFEPDANGLMHAVDVTDLIAAGATGKETMPDDGDEPVAREGGPLPLRALGNLNRAVAGPDGIYFRLPDTIAQFLPDGTAKLHPATGRYGQLFMLDDTLHVENLELGLQKLATGKLAVVPGAEHTGAFAARATGDGWWLLTLQGPRFWRGPGHAPDALSDAGVFKEQNPTCALFLADGRSAYGTTRSGVFIFDATGRLEQRIDRERGLPANRVNGLAEDAEGGLWLAQHTGLVRVQLDSPFAVHGLTQGLPGGPRQVLRAGNRLYVTHGEGLSWRDDRTGQFESVPGFRAGTHHAITHGDDVVVTAQGLHTITADGKVRAETGPYLYDAIGWRHHPGWMLASSTVALRLYRADPAGNWVGAGQLTTLPTGADDLLETADGWLWVVTRIGEIWRVDFRQGPRPDAPAQRYGAERGVPPILRRNGIRLLEVGPDLLVSSTHGVLRYNPAADRFEPETRFSELTGIGRNGPVMAAPAADGGAWFYFASPQPRLVHLLPPPASRIEVVAAPPLRELILNNLGDDPPLHTLWVAGQGALVSVDLEWRAAHAPPPLRAVLRRIAALDGQTLAGGNTANLGLPAGRDAMRFEFAAPAFASDYRGRADTLYRTRLDGLDREWTPWTTESHRDFTNLPSGPLTFRLQAQDLSGRIGEETRFAFTLAPRWWRTSWAYAGAGLAVVLGVVGIVKLRTHALRAREHELEVVVAERTRELERLRKLDLDEKAAANLAAEKAQLEMLRYQLNPHFLFNAFNSVYGFVYPHSKEAAELVRHLADFCRHTLTRGRDELQTLAEEFAMLRTYLDIEQLRWRERLTVTVSAEPAVAGVNLPAFLLLPLVENAIKHGGATSPGHLEVELTAKSDGDGGLIITVANTGRWLAVDEPREQPSTGIGLENLRQRLQGNFPGAHELVIEKSFGRVSISLHLFPGRVSRARPAVT